MELRAWLVQLDDGPVIQGSGFRAAAGAGNDPNAKPPLLLPDGGSGPAHNALELLMPGTAGANDGNKVRTDVLEFCWVRAAISEIGRLAAHILGEVKF